MSDTLTCVDVSAVAAAKAWLRRMWATSRPPTRPDGRYWVPNVRPGTGGRHRARRG